MYIQPHLHKSFQARIFTAEMQRRELTTDHTDNTDKDAGSCIISDIRVISG